MRNFNNTNEKRVGRMNKLVSWVLVITMLIQILSVSCFAITGGEPLFSGSSSSNGGIVNGIGGIDIDDTVAQLKKDFLGSLNKDLVKKISDYELRGEVGAIISFSDRSLITEFTGSKYSKKMTFSEYRVSSAAEKLRTEFDNNRADILTELQDSGIITDVKYSFYNIIDGAYVRTSYENIEALCNFEGVERVIISNQYEPAVAVENPVDVYDTGIFNSGSVSYTGKGTIVAILDSGCDYTHSAFTTHQVESPLYNRDQIAEILSETLAYTYNPNDSVEVREVYYGNITKDKIAFGYDYADKDTDIMPFSSSHGTHVAGIIGGQDDTITGVAIDTQLAIMKVFSDYETGAQDGDILAALEDAITLGVDAINMSLGSSCGFTREVDEQYKNELYDRIEEAGISLIVAASNDYSSGFGSSESNTNKTDNPDSATVGAPSTYNAAMSVASINGRKEHYILVNGNTEVFFNEAYNMASDEYSFFEMLGLDAVNTTAEFEYVTVPGYGYAINYTGLEIEGKIALVRRGDITFEEKVQYAYEAGAAGIIIYNNIFGEITMTVGNDLQIPVVSITKDDGDAMAAQPSGTIVVDYGNEAGPFMSDFSSWGPTPDLKLKPEITAHGGNILSSIVGNEYEEQSGTSMASPNMCGITVLIRQYVKENFKELSVAQQRDLVNELCMSTATIALDKKGNPYSPRKQGAGIADIAKATTTPAYLYVLDAEGKDIGKTKLELGDDPERKGVYEMVINIKNISDQSATYKLGSIVMTESVSSSEPEYVAEIAYLLSSETTFVVDGKSLSAGEEITVNAGESKSISVTITLSKEDKSYLNSTFANGMYIEGFLTFESIEGESGIDLNAPFLAFFGDWGEAPIFDLDYYEVETEAHNNAIDDDDKIKADYYATTPTGSYYYDYVLPLGSYVYSMDTSLYTAIPATEEHAALSYFEDTINGIYGVFAGLLRGAKELKISVVNTATGKEVWSDVQYNCYKAHFNGSAYPYMSRFNLPVVNTETGEILGDNNTRFEVTMSAKLDWNGEERNSSDTYTFSFYIDYEAPSVVDATFRTEWDKSREEYRHYADIIVYDNHYAMSIRPIIAYTIMDEGEEKRTYSSLIDDPIPIYQENRGSTSKVTIEITDYLDTIAESAHPEGLTVYIDDYALNAGVCFIPFPDTESSDLEFMVNGSKTTELALDINDTLDLTKYLAYTDETKTVNSNFLNTLTWTTSDESVVAIYGGKIEAKAHGTAIIKVTGSTWKSGGTQIYKNLVINVSETVSDNPESSANVPIEGIDFVYYDTLFAFNSDIDYSEIGVTGSTNYFGGSNNISFYPSEKIQLHYRLDPWNLSPDRYQLKWETSNPKVVTVDENGVVTAQAEGSARITLKIIVDGKTSILAARCSVNVKSEFIIENRSLVAYKGWGGNVVIPDDEGIMSIGAFAFSHYDLDNEKEVEKDKDGYYDIDDKKTALGNDTVVSVVIPEGVETIDKYAFYGCKKLEDVTLPKSCKTIGAAAFQDCVLLENINLGSVSIINDMAFFNCGSLTCEDIGGVDLSNAYAIGVYGFKGARFSEVNLPKLSLTGRGAFENCTKLTKVELGKKTRIAQEMFKNTPIEQIVIYSDVVGDSAFVGCNKLVSVEFKNDLTHLGDEAFSGCKALATVAFDKGCESIGYKAFYQCEKLENLTLPAGEVVIGDYAFAESGLGTVKLAATTVISSIGISAFEGVTGLKVNPDGNGNYVLSDNAIYTADGKGLVLVLSNSTTFTVPAAVTHIHDGAFNANTKITTVTFATGSLLQSIGDGAFANCTKLNSIVLPANKITIGEFAFSGTTRLSSIDLSKVKSVGAFAFESSAISSVNLISDGVSIGDGAFYACTSLKNVTLGKGAEIGIYAFAESGVISVDILGSVTVDTDGNATGGATVGDAAFYNCSKLSSFDFANVIGKIGDEAFMNCVSLQSVDAPYVTAIGAGSFADCYALTSFKADKVVIAGDYAFAHSGTDSAQYMMLNKVELPTLKSIGKECFYGCEMLKTIDISSVTEIGEYAFAVCSGLETVIMPEELDELKDMTFGLCISLTNIDLSGVKKFGTAVIHGAKISELNLESAEYIGSMAFTEKVLFSDSQGNPVYTPDNNLTTVNAPNAIWIDDYAFYGCKNITSISAPKLEVLGYMAFTETAISEFEISESFNNPNTESDFYNSLDDETKSKFLNGMGSAAFEACTSLVKFYVTEGNEKLADKVFENAMVKDGVLYTINENGYTLVCYPAAKTGTEFTVPEGTFRIDYSAAYGNTNLVKVILPESLRYVGNRAFYACDNLNKVVFKSYYAPVLEGSMTGNQLEITPETKDNYPGFDSLYKYDYYFRVEGIIASPLYYATFVDTVTTEKAQGLTYVIPQNCEGYDSRLYKAYFTVAEGEDAGFAMGPYAISFIEAVKKLPAVADRFDAKVINAAINAYNALEGKAEMDLVDSSYFERFNKARSEYNVSVAENKIAHLFDMDNAKYFYDLVKDARTTYLALTDAERALVKNAQALDTKIAELSEAMGKTLDFTLTYEEHFPEEEPIVDDQNDDGLETWAIILIVVGGVLVLCGIGAGVYFFLKKRGIICKKVEESAEDSLEDEATENEEAVSESEAEEALTQDAEATDALAEENSEDETAEETSDNEESEEGNS